MSADGLDDAAVRSLLAGTVRVAVVGASGNPGRPSHRVMQFLIAQGFAVTPVNPGLAGQTLLGSRVVAGLEQAVALDMPGEPLGLDMPGEPLGLDMPGEPLGLDMPGEPLGLDMVDIFRATEHVGPVVDEAIRLGARSVWMQLGIVDQAAAKRARDAGLTVVMDRCPAIEWPRLRPVRG